MSCDTPECDVAAGLPQRLRAKISRRTIRRRLAARGYTPSRKLEKSAFLTKQRAARVAWCQAHQHRTPKMWAKFLQGCGDLKDFTYFPRKMKTRFARYRCAWTYMKHSERSKAEFLKPKPNQMFSRKEYKASVRKGKVFVYGTQSAIIFLCKAPAPGEKTSDAKSRLQALQPRA